MKKLLTLISIILIISCGDKVREEITERYEDGKKKTVMKYIIEGETEQLLEKLIYSDTGDTLIWKYYNN